MVDAAHRERRRGHRRGHPGPAPQAHPVRCDRDRSRRPYDRRLPREARRPAEPARTTRGPVLRLDGQLRVHHRGAARGAPPGRRRRGLGARHGRQHHPDAHRAGRRAGLRLRRERGARRDRARPGLLARRRHDRRVLRRAHGPRLVHPIFNLYNRQMADPDPAAVAAAGQVRRGWQRARVDGRQRVDRRGRPRALESCSSNDVIVDEGAYVEGAVLMPGVRIGRGAVVRRAILDKNVVVPDGAQIGVEPEQRTASATP